MNVEPGFYRITYDHADCASCRRCGRRALGKVKRDAVWCATVRRKRQRGDPTEHRAVVVWVGPRVLLPTREAAT